MAVLGQNVTLTISEGEAPPLVMANSIEWYKDDSSTPIKASPRLVFAVDRQSLSVVSVVREDAGYYQVRMSLPTGVVSVYITLQVKEEMDELRIVGEGDQNVSMDSGQRVSFICRAYGVPTPTVVWLRGTFPITSDRMTVTTEGEPQDGGAVSSTLTINNLIAADEETYFCKAITDAIYAVHSFDLGVHQLVDVCLPNPCRNGGRCVAAVSSMECMCVDGFIGLLCDTRMLIYTYIYLHNRLFQAIYQSIMTVVTSCSFFSVMTMAFSH